MTINEILRFPERTGEAQLATLQYCITNRSARLGQQTFELDPSQLFWFI